MFKDYKVCQKRCKIETCAICQKTIRCSEAIKRNCLRISCQNTNQKVQGVLIFDDIFLMQRYPSVFLLFLLNGQISFTAQLIIELSPKKKKMIIIIVGHHMCYTPHCPKKKKKKEKTCYNLYIWAHTCQYLILERVQIESNTSAVCHELAMFLN